MFQFGGAPGLPTYTVDCSSEGRGVLSGAPLLLKKMVGEQILTASIEIPVSISPTRDQSQCSSIDRR